jgi:hypothetical protein
MFENIGRIPVDWSIETQSRGDAGIVDKASDHSVLVNPVYRSVHASGNGIFDGRRYSTRYGAMSDNFGSIEFKHSGAIIGRLKSRDIPLTSTHRHID